MKFRIGIGSVDFLFIKHERLFQVIILAPIDKIVGAATNHNANNLCFFSSLDSDRFSFGYLPLSHGHLLHILFLL